MKHNKTNVNSTVNRGYTEIRWHVMSNRGFNFVQMVNLIHVVKEQFKSSLRLLLKQIMKCSHLSVNNLLHI